MPQKTTIVDKWITLGEAWEDFHNIAAQASGLVRRTHHEKLFCNLMSFGKEILPKYEN